ncbi:hypothetical protein OAP63_01165 [Vibrio sp.]|nr:hypothetical protein [Vibrio viridaestus]MDC0609317.1 hypothetical protein [Vibrio sp.]
MSFSKTTCTASRPAPRMPMPNRHINGQGHHRAPQKPNHNH